MDSIKKNIQKIINLEPDALQCEIKWAIGSITMHKASEDDGIPAQLFEILKRDAAKVLHSVCQQIWKTQQWPQDWKRSFFHSNPKERQCQRIFKLPYSCSHLISMSAWKCSIRVYCEASAVCELRTSTCTNWI